jgi:hypothetical protein
VQETVVTEALQYGIVGLIAVVFAFVIVQQWREGRGDRRACADEVKALQEARIADAKAIQAQMLDIIKQCTSALSTVSANLDVQREATLELKDTLKEFGERLERFGERLDRPRRG